MLQTQVNRPCACTVTDSCVIGIFLLPLRLVCSHTEVSKVARSYTQQGDETADKAAPQGINTVRWPAMAFSQLQPGAGDSWLHLCAG